MAETAADVVRVAIVDDHEVVRVGLRNMIDRQPDLTVVAECATGTEAIQTLPPSNRCGGVGCPVAGHIGI